MTGILALLAVALSAAVAHRRGYARGRAEGTQATVKATSAAMQYADRKVCLAASERDAARAERDDLRAAHPGRVNAAWLDTAPGSAWLDTVLALARHTPGTHDDDTDGFHRIHAGTGTDGDPT